MRDHLTILSKGFSILLPFCTRDEMRDISTAGFFAVAACAILGAGLCFGADRDLSGDPTEALVFMIAGQSNAGGFAAFSEEANAKSGLGKHHRTIPGSTADEVGIPTTKDAYPRCYIWKPGRSGPFERLTPGKNLQTDAIRHGIELPMAMLLEKKYPTRDKFFIKHGPGGHNLHTQWAARSGPDYKNFLAQYNGAMADLKKRYKKIRIIGLYWDQGESDGSKAKEYGRNLQTLIAALRVDTGMPTLQIYVRKVAVHCVKLALRDFGISAIPLAWMWNSSSRMSPKVT
jgi:hypothetical protein